jgi:hypothetical protein
MNPAEQVLRRVDRYQQQHPWVGVPFAVVKKLILVTVLGYLLGHHRTLEQQVLHSALAEFPILGTQLEQNVHALRANGIGLAIGIAGSLWGARGVTQAGQHAMAELWNIPGKDRPSFWTRQVRGLALLLVFAVGLAATTLLTGLGSLGSHSAGFRPERGGQGRFAQRPPGRLVSLARPALTGPATSKQARCTRRSTLARITSLSALPHRADLIPPHPPFTHYPPQYHRNPTKDSSAPRRALANEATQQLPDIVREVVSRRQIASRPSLHGS